MTSERKENKRDTRPTIEAPTAASMDELLQAVDNLRGYRVAEQGPFLAHVDSIYRRIVDREPVVTDEMIERAARALYGHEIGQLERDDVKLVLCAALEAPDER